MRTLFTLLLLVAVGLSGCADSAPADASSDDDPFQSFEEELEATADTGVIRGVVVDQSITPIPGVAITVAATELSAETNEDGAFGFSDLAPGFYQVKASKVGYGEITTQAEVVAGVSDPPVLRVMLEFDPSSLPEWQTFTFDGYIQCSTVTVVLSAAVCSFPGLVGIETDDQFIQYTETTGDPDTVQVEVLWESTQPTGANLQLDNFGGNSGVHGPSPLIIREDTDYWAGGANRATDDGQIAWRIFAGWVDGTNPAGGWGVGVVLEQRFEMFTTQFYRTQPTESWLFTVDGEWTE